MRCVIGAASMRNFECTLADHHVDAREQLLGPVERAVFEDVALDAREDAERLSISSFSSATTSSCSRNRSAVSPCAIFRRGE